MNQMVFTAEQKKIINASPSSYLLVEAGPGTGKTAVACKRVANLIENEGVSPTEILIVSFTRAAVIEIRNRIASFLNEKSSADSIVISTIDSFSYRVRRGFSQERALEASYEEGIVSFSRLLQENPNAREYLSGWKHIIIDEAQDIFSPRAEAILDVLHFLSEECGVTIFCDQAQAIYGFTKAGEDVFEEVVASLDAQSEEEQFEEFEDDESETSNDPDEPLDEEIDVNDDLLASRNLVSVIDEYSARKYEHVYLTKIHRTTDKKLLGLLVKGRKMLSMDDSSGLSVHRNMTELIKASANEAITEGLEEIFDEIEDGSLILFRNRAEVLEASQFAKSHDHRLRLSGRPTLIHPWIGILFGDLGLQEINVTKFEQLWQARLDEFEDINWFEAWSLLVKHAGKNKDAVDLAKLARVLSVTSPPEEFCLPEFGFRGPILGTIHASKGREAERVYLFLQKGAKKPSLKSQEEARVAFVGASRAKVQLFFAEAKFKLSSKQGKRNFSRIHRGKAQVEFGLKNDIYPEGLVGDFYFTNSNVVHEAQDFLRKNAFNTYRLKAVTRGAIFNWAYELVSPSANQRLAYLNPAAVNPDLFAIKRRVNGYSRHLPSQIDFLSAFGSYTVAVNPGDPLLDTLRSPWKESYFMLAPMVSGYSTLYFN